MREQEKHNQAATQTLDQVRSRGHLKRKNHSAVILGRLAGFKSMGTDIAKDATAKMPEAVAFGRLGGLKGGKARAEKLTPERRREIALKAAKAPRKRK